MQSQFDDEDICDIPDLNKEYYYTFNFKCKGFTLLMKLVLLTKKNPELVSQIAQYLTEFPGEINEQNEYGWTALMIACRNSTSFSSGETIKMLIGANANLNIQNKDGWTALIISSVLRETSTVIMLVESDLNIRTNFGSTALSLAKRLGLTENVKILVEAGNRT